MKSSQDMIQRFFQQSSKQFRGIQHVKALLLVSPRKQQRLPSLSSSIFSPSRYAFEPLNIKRRRWLSGPCGNLQLVQKLRRETDELIDIASGKSPEQSTKDRHDCDRVLQAWAEQAEIGGEEGFAAAEEAHRLFNVLYENMKTKKSFVFIPKGAFPYNNVLHAYSISKNGRQGAERSQSILMQMLQDCKDYISNRQMFRSPPPEPDDVSFNCVVQAWARSGEEDAGDRARELLFLMNGWRKNCDIVRQKDKAFPYKGCHLDERTIVATIGALSHSKDGPEKAFEMVMNLIDAAKESGDSRGSVLTVYVFNTLMDAWVKCGRGSEAAEKVEQIFELMPKVNVPPDIVTYNTLLDAWSRAEDVNGSGVFSQKADECLRNMIDSYRNGKGVKPDVTSFTTVISAWSRCKTNRNAPDRAEIVYKFLIELYEETGDNDFRPDVRTGSSLVTLWSRAMRRPDSMTRARQALDMMKRFNQANLITYNALVDGYAKRGMGKEAYDLLSWLLKESIEGNTNLQPDLITCNAVLNALAKDKRPESAERAQELLHKMDLGAMSGKAVQPDTISYTSVIDAWSRSAGMQSRNTDSQMKAAKSAETVLRRMVTLFEEKKTVKPNVFAFTACITAWSRCDHPSAPENAERLYNKLAQLFEQTGDFDFRPTVVTISAVVTAWSRAIKHPDSIKRAVQIVKQSEQYASPNIVTYNALLDGYAKRGMEKEAYTLLNHLKKLSADGALNGKLNTISYTSVLNAFAKDKQSNPSQLAKHADELLDEMKLNARHNPEIKPNKISYQCAIYTWSRLPCDSVERFERANTLVREMIDAASQGDVDMKPQAFFLITYLRSFSQSSGKADHVQVAIDTVCDAFATLKYNDVKEREYLDYIKTIDQFVKGSSDRRRLLDQVFSHACEGGNISPSLFAALHKLSPNVVPTKVEKSWSRNVKK